MSWQANVVANNFDGLSTWDSIAPAPGFYSGIITWRSSCNVNNMAGMIALKSVGKPGVFPVQGIGTASTFNSGGFATWTAAFTNPNTFGNCIVVDVVYNCASRFGVATTVADSQGNTYSKINGNFVGGSSSFLEQWVAFNVAAGANTVTVTQTGAFNFQAVSLAIQEYSNATSADVVNWQGGTHANTLTCTLLTTGAYDLLHIAAGTETACPGAVATGGGTLPPLPTSPPFFANLSPPPLQTPITQAGAQAAGSGTPYELQGLPSGDLASAWAGWFNAVYQFLLSLGLSGGAGSQAAIIIKQNYSPSASDYGRLLALNSTTPQTLTLPNPAVNAMWNLYVQNIGSALWTVDPNGLSLNGRTPGTTFSLPPSTGLYIATDGANYFAAGSAVVVG